MIQNHIQKARRPELTSHHSRALHPRRVSGGHEGAQYNEWAHHARSFLFFFAFTIGTANGRFSRWFLPSLRRSVFSSVFGRIFKKKGHYGPYSTYSRFFVAFLPALMSTNGRQAPRETTSGGRRSFGWVVHCATYHLPSLAGAAKKNCVLRRGPGRKGRI